MQCREIMRERVATLPPQASLADAARLMKTVGCGMIPICSPDKEIVGVLTDRDIVIRACAEGRSLAKTPVSAIMTKELVTCEASDSVHSAEELLARHQKARILVTEGGRLVGVISLPDIAQNEEPLRLARVVRQISAREYRVEH
jgi:CBS domain-containing protein